MSQKQIIKEYISKSSKQTENIGKEMAKYILLEKNKSIVIALEGNLGGGKTTFLKGLAKELGIKEKILSPTFIIFRKINIPKKRRNFFHFDCYRIDDKRELKELGFKKILEDKNNIIAIEWPSVVKDFLPKRTIFINFDFIDEKTRKISIVEKI